MINEPILGNKKNIIGTDKADLVLETLGKVYIKQGKSLKNLTDLFKLIDKKSNKVLNKEESTIIVNSINNLQYPGDGKFIFSSSDRILYITFENQLIPLIDARNYGTDNHILKSGDDMEGILNFKVPFTIQSASLINNLNSNFLNGYRDIDFTKKSVNEIISGNWTFTGNNESTNKFVFKDIVVNNTIGTSAFQGGYTGYGWQLDTKTNTLTIDNLIVRKLLSVYELVVNQIRATNGTLWVTNSATVDSTYNLYVENSETVNYLNRLYNSSYYMYDNYYNIKGDTFRARILIMTDMNNNGVFPKGFSVAANPRANIPQYGKNLFEAYVLNSKKLIPNGYSLCQNNYYCGTLGKYKFCGENGDYSACLQRVMNDGWEIKYNY